MVSVLRSIGIAGVCFIALPAAAQQWEQMPRMQLERQYAGPLKDTVMQRWRDPVDGTICYIYLPINAPHTPQTGSGYVQYGSSTIGSISCIAAAAATAQRGPAPAAAPAAPPAPRPPAAPRQ